MVQNEIKKKPFINQTSKVVVHDVNLAPTLLIYTFVLHVLQKEKWTFICTFQNKKCKKTCSIKTADSSEQYYTCMYLLPTTLIISYDVSVCILPRE